MIAGWIWKAKSSMLCCSLRFLVQAPPAYTRKACCNDVFHALDPEVLIQPHIRASWYARSVDCGLRYVKTTMTMTEAAAPNKEKRV